MPGTVGPNRWQTNSPHPVHWLPAEKRPGCRHVLAGHDASALPNLGSRAAGLICLSFHVPVRQTTPCLGTHVDDPQQDGNTRLWRIHNPEQPPSRADTMAGRGRRKDPVMHTHSSTHSSNHSSNACSARLSSLILSKVGGDGPFRRGNRGSTAAKGSHLTLSSSSSKPLPPTFASQEKPSTRNLLVIGRGTALHCTPLLPGLQQASPQIERQFSLPRPAQLQSFTSLSPSPVSASGSSQREQGRHGGLVYNSKAPKNLGPSSQEKKGHGDALPTTILGNALCLGRVTTLFPSSSPASDKQFQACFAQPDTETKPRLASTARNSPMDGLAQPAAPSFPNILCGYSSSVELGVPVNYSSRLHASDTHSVIRVALVLSLDSPKMSVSANFPKSKETTYPPSPLQDTPYRILDKSFSRPPKWARQKEVSREEGSREEGSPVVSRPPRFPSSPHSSSISLFFHFADSTNLYLALSWNIIIPSLIWSDAVTTIGFALVGHGTEVVAPTARSSEKTKRRPTAGSRTNPTGQQPGMGIERAGAAPAVVRMATMEMRIQMGETMAMRGNKGRVERKRTLVPATKERRRIAILLISTNMLAGFTIGGERAIETLTMTQALAQHKGISSCCINDFKGHSRLAADSVIIRILPGQHNVFMTWGIFRDLRKFTNIPGHGTITRWAMIKTYHRGTIIKGKMRLKEGVQSVQGANNPMMKL
ncbi:hypothetical protein HRG_014730 [Hirsutella rhossiliensis]